MTSLQQFQPKSKTVETSSSLSSSNVDSPLLPMPSLEELLSNSDTVDHGRRSLQLFRTLPESPETIDRPLSPWPVSNFPFPPPRVDSSSSSSSPLKYDRPVSPWRVSIGPLAPKRVERLPSSSYSKFKDFNPLRLQRPFDQRSQTCHCPSSLSAEPFQEQSTLSRQGFENIHRPLPPSIPFIPFRPFLSETVVKPATSSPNNWLLDVGRQQPHSSKSVVIKLRNKRGHFFEASSYSTNTMSNPVQAQNVSNVPFSSLSHIKKMPSLIPIQHVAGQPFCQTFPAQEEMKFENHSVIKFARKNRKQSTPKRIETTEEEEETTDSEHEEEEEKKTQTQTETETQTEEERTETETEEETTMKQSPKKKRRKCFKQATRKMKRRKCTLKKKKCFCTLCKNKN